jgi:hypothetical protein
MSDEDDWRLGRQERYLQPARLCWKRYSRWSDEWDHDHCAFCWARFVALDDPQKGPNDLSEGYAVLSNGHFPDDYLWICATCYADFRGMFDWEVVS